MIIDCDTHFMPRDAFDRVGDDFSQRANPKISEVGKELIRWGTASRLFHLDGSPANG